MCQHFVSTYRAVFRAELTAILHQAGFVEQRWLMPTDSGFYQPMLIARNATSHGTA
jgi:glycine/sarcosine N-methyltransferase